jgi:hypothetical protein
MRPYIWAHVIVAIMIFVVGLMAQGSSSCALEDQATRWPSSVRRRGARAALLSPTWEVFLIYELFKSLKELWKAADWKNLNP